MMLEDGGACEAEDEETAAELFADAERECGEPRQTERA